MPSRHSKNLARGCKGRGHTGGYANLEKGQLASHGCQHFHTLPGVPLGNRRANKMAGVETTKAKVVSFQNFNPIAVRLQEKLSL